MYDPSAHALSLSTCSQQQQTQQHQLLSRRWRQQVPQRLTSPLRGANVVLGAAHHHFAKNVALVVSPAIVVSVVLLLKAGVSVPIVVLPLRLY